MDLETITVNIRPRTPWEAIDIGFILARRCYWKLWLLWILASIPSLILLTGLSLLLPGSTPKWALLLFWFFKPIYEPSLLFWISRDLFGSQNSIRNSITEVRQKLSFKRIRTILFYRFSPFRSFSLPVLLLEELGKKEGKNRRTLLRDGYETSAILTVVGFCIETILTLSLMSVLYWLISEELRWVDLGDFIFLPDNWLLLLSYVVSSSIFAPFYICSGFMMYISRRVELEAWDIEIGFKRVQQRLLKKKNGFSRTASALFLLCSISLACLPDKGWSAPLDPETARDTITTVLEQKEFGETVTKQRWVQKEKYSPDSDSTWGDFWQNIFDSLEEFFDELAPLLAKYGEFLLWCCAGIIIAFLLLKYSSLRHWLGSTFRSTGHSYTPPEIMFGMDLRPESLPDDIGRVSIELLTQGKKREAISLLYRGTLSKLVNSYDLEIHSSFTENECCGEVQNNRPKPEAAFFSSLTSLWVFTAYGHRDPNTEVCSQLINRWVNLYGVQS
jgi:hypothetical protein